jgi:NADH-quinone oxidoreductase subunit E
MTLREETRTAIERARDRYPRARSAILPALWAVQHEQGQITPDAMTEVAGILQVTPSEVEAVSTFYSMYFQHPHGRHEVIVCINVSCALRGADDIVGHLERSLGCASGETTTDGAFTWSSTVECLGGCGGAPTMQVDHHFQENLTPDRVDEILGAMRSASSAGEAGPVVAGTPRRRASGAPALPPATPPAAPSAAATGQVAEASPAQGSASHAPPTGAPKKPAQRRGKAAQ